jgi:hypothetical protein
MGPRTLDQGISVFRRELAGGKMSRTYYCRFRVRRKDGTTRRAQLNTGCTDQRAAEKWARAQAEAARSDQRNQVLVARMSQARPGVAQVGAMIDAYMRHQTGALEATARRQALDFLLVWREALDTDDAGVRRLPVTGLTRDALRGWIARRQGLTRPSFREALPANNTIRARMRSVRAILSPRLADAWAEAGLAIPDFAGLLAVPMPEATEKPFRMIPPAALVEMEAAAAGADENVRRAFLLMRHLALRNSEVAACRVGWAERWEGRLMLRVCHRPGEFTLKRRENVRLLEIPPALHSIFDGAADAYILAGSRTERQSATFRRLCILVRRWMPRDERTKAAYILRGQRISEEMVENGIEAAAALAGDLIATIERHYCDIAANLPALRQGRLRVV